SWAAFLRTFVSANSHTRRKGVLRLCLRVGLAYGAVWRRQRRAPHIMVWGQFHGYIEFRATPAGARHSSGRQEEPVHPAGGGRGRLGGLFGRQGSRTGGTAAGCASGTRRGGTGANRRSAGSGGRCRHAIGGVRGAYRSG